jgi:hypothetical protein
MKMPDCALAHQDPSHSIEWKAYVVFRERRLSGTGTRYIIQFRHLPPLIERVVVGE